MYIIGYGMGEIYHQIRSLYSEKIRLDYVMDCRFEGTEEKEYEGIRILRTDELKSISEGKEKATILLFPRNQEIEKYVKNMIADDSINIIRAEAMYPIYSVLTGKDLQMTKRGGEYCDGLNNYIQFDESIPSNIQISLKGRDSRIVIGKEIQAKSLSISVGSKAKIVIGDRSTFVSTHISVAYNECIIGRDCMFADEIVVMAHDGHHIFDMIDGHRINYPKRTCVSDHVWVGTRAMILNGAQIGEGSVVGAGAVVSSEIPNNVICGGVPASVIKKNICWTREGTMIFNRENIIEC